GRLRALYGPGGEQAALRLYRKLPRGRELGSSTRAVSDAVAALEGRRLERVALQSVGPGAFLLTLAAGGRELSLRLDRQGARLSSAAAGWRTATTWRVSTSRGVAASSSAAGRLRSRRCTGCSPRGLGSRSSRPRSSTSCATSASSSSSARTAPTTSTVASS